MQVLSLSRRQLKKLQPLNLSRKIPNTEARLYIHDTKKNFIWNRELLKVFYNQDLSNIANKIATISQIILLFEKIDAQELVLPTKLVSIDDKLSGYGMPYIEDNVNLSLILNNPKIKLEIKLAFLKEILQILLKLENSYELKGKFHLGDIHEANFVLDINEQKVKVVDLDSAYIRGGREPIAKFITANKNLQFASNKYIVTATGDNIVPNENTVSLSFIYLLLNVLSGDNSYKWTIEEYYIYISHLKQLGISKDLLEVLSNVYTCGSSLIYPEMLKGIKPNKDYTLKRTLN